MKLILFIIKRSYWNKAFNIAENPKYDDGYQRGLASMVYNFFW